MDEKRFVKLLWIAKTALVAVLIYAGFEVATSRLHVAPCDPHSARGEQLSASEPPGLPAARDPADYSTIVHRNLFGQSQDAEAPTPAPAAGGPRAAEPLAVSQELGLRLIGAIAGAPAAARAILQDTRSNTAGSYRVGDTVASATVEAIARDAVVLSYQGRPLVLKLRAGTAAERPPKTPESGPESTSGRDRPASGERAVASDSVRRARPNQAEYVGDLLRQATIEPCVKNDRIEGLKISDLDKSPMAQMLGFKNGDIVQSVNGQQLTSKLKAFQVLMKARTQPKVDIRFLRDGKSKSLSFNL
jgi:type II secretion system protein C